jgi:hypothetical protein
VAEVLGPRDRAVARQRRVAVGAIYGWGLAP